VYGATGRMNRTIRSTITARLPFDAWNPVERETNSRQSCNVSLTRFASRGVLWSFIFIPHMLPCRFLIALTIPGLLGHSTKSCPVDRPGARVHRRAPAFLSAGDSEAGSVRLCWNRPVVTSSTAVPTLTQRAGHPERNPGASSVPGMPVRFGPRRDARNVSKLIYPAGASVARRNARSRPAARVQIFFSGLSRTRHAARAPRYRRHANPVKNAECFKPDT
jgi:hypothetical protein